MDKFSQKMQSAFSVSEPGILPAGNQQPVYLQQLLQHEVRNKNYLDDEFVFVGDTT